MRSIRQWRPTRCSSPLVCPFCIYALSLSVLAPNVKDVKRTWSCVNTLTYCEQPWPGNRQLYGYNSKSVCVVVFRWVCVVRHVVRGCVRVSLPLASPCVVQAYLRNQLKALQRAASGETLDSSVFPISAQGMCRLFSIASFFSPVLPSRELWLMLLHSLCHCVAEDVVKDVGGDEEEGSVTQGVSESTSEA